MVESTPGIAERSDASLERGSQAVHRVLRILLCWKEQDSTLSLTEIAQRTGLTLPTAHRMIKALQREGFLVHDKISGNYALGPTILDLARVLLQRSDQDELVVTVIPHLERMREITGETVGLHIPMGDLRMCLAELVSRRTIRTATGVGRTFPLPGGASGQVLTAWSEERMEMVEPPDRVRRVPSQSCTIVSPQVRENQLRDQRGRDDPRGERARLPPLWAEQGRARRRQHHRARPPMDPRGDDVAHPER